MDGQPDGDSASRNRRRNERLLQLSIAPNDGPVTIEVLEGERVVATESVLDEVPTSKAIVALRSIAPEVAARPDVFAGRIVLISLFDVGREAVSATQDLALLARVAERLWQRLRPMVGLHDLLLEVAASHFLVVSSEKDPWRGSRWETGCREVAGALLGEASSDAIRVYCLDGGDESCLRFSAAGKRVEVSGSDEKHRQETAERRPSSPGGWTLFYHEQAPLRGSGFRTRRIELPAFEARYAPVWDVPNQVFSILITEAFRKIGGKWRRGFEAMPEARHDDRLMLKFCLSLLGRVTEQVRALHAAGRPGFVTAPVHFDALATNSRLTRYMRVLRDIDPELRQRMCMVLAGVPVGVNAMKLQSIIETLRPTVRAVFLRIGLNDPRWVLRLNTRVDAVSIHVVDDPEREPEMINYIGRFAEACRVREISPCVLGLNTTSLVLSAAAAGVRFVGGDRIAPPKTSPVGARAFSWLDFYTRSGS